MHAFDGSLRESGTSRRSGIAGALGTAVLAFLGGSPEAAAVDGLVEISHTKAIAGGVTSGDAPGYPVVISASGSYRLTSNLTVPGPGGGAPADLDGIQITADDVTLDLNGFTISCRRSTLPASPCSSGSGIGRGIVATGVNVRIANGTIRDMADDGALVGADASYVLESVLFRNNGGDGFRAGTLTDGRILRSAFRDNGGAGLSFSSNASALVLETSTAGNASSGVFLDGATSVFGSELLLSDEPGFELGLGLLGCVVFGSTRFCP